MDAEVLKRLDALAAKLGVAAEHLWAVLIKQAPIEALTDFGYLVGVVVAVFFFVRWAKKYIAEEYRSEGEGLAIAVCGIVLAILSVIVVVACSEIPTLLLNPEYWALMKVIGK